MITGAEGGMLEVLLREPGKPRPALFASAGAAVMAEVQTTGPGAAEIQRMEASDGVVRGKRNAPGPE